MIIGLTGTKASGKGAIADILKQKGFEYSSTSDRVREQAIIKFRHASYTNKDLQDIGNELRTRYGPGILVKQTIDRLSTTKSQDWVIDGIRNLGEIEELREQKGEVYIIGVDAKEEERYDRLVKRARGSDPMTWEGFLEMEKRDLGQGENSLGQQTSACIEAADYFYYNNAETLDELTKDFTSGDLGFLNLLSDSGSKPRRPHFNEINMRQAYEWGKRSTCLRRDVGATLVDTKRNTLFSQGYNGAGRGVPHCKDRGGCYRQQNNIPSGERLEDCWACHAEANSITNAAKRGISPVGTKMFATVYPCKNCANLINQSEIEEVIYLTGYPNDKMSKDILKYGDVKVTKYQKGVSPKAFHEFWG